MTCASFSDVCTKYQEASKIVNLALKGLMEQCVVGAKVLDLCKVSPTVMTCLIAHSVWADIIDA